MNAVISGIAGRALLIDGDSLKSFDVDDPSKLVVRQHADVPYLFGEGRDLRVIEDANLDLIAKELKSDTNLALALDLALISLDEEVEEDIRKDAINELEDLLDDAPLRERLEGILYAHPIPADGDLAGALRSCDRSHFPNSFALFHDLERRQALISKVCAGWDVIPTKIFGGYERQSEFERIAAQRGLFRSLVLTLENLQSVSTFLLTAGLDHSITQLNNYRQVLQTWASPYREIGEQRIIHGEIDEKHENKTVGRRKRGRRVDIDRPAVLSEVNRRKAIISGAMKRSDFGIVRELTDDLVEYQLHSGEAEHVAKSLCDLAMEAKELGMFSLQLALTERSIGVAPSDAWSWAQHGDALLRMNRLDKSLAAYEQADSFGAGVIAKTGRAEVLKAQGRLTDALAAFDEVIQQHPENAVAKHGRAEVLKAQGRLTDALAAFDEVIQKHPENAVARTGRISVLAATGRYEDALSCLPEKKPATLDDWINYHILGMIRLRTGKMVEAIRIFDEGVKSNPWPSSRDYFSRALGLAWLRGRDFQKASEALDKVKSPLLQPAANVLRIHAFGAQGDVQRASVAYESLSTAPHLRTDEVTQELRHQFILRKPPRKNEEWIVDREAQILILAA
jgi:tetratricopeptide (TPR) repeat protein